MLQQEHGLRVEQVQLALAAPLVLAADLEAPVGPLGLVGRVRLGVPGRDLGVDLGQPDAADLRRGAGEVPLAPVRASSPTASKTWAPQYEETVEMPILDMIFRTPLPSALT